MADITVNTRLIAAKDMSETPLRRAVRRLFRRKSAVFGLAVVAFFIALAVFAPLLSPYDPVAQSWSLVRHPPSASHWLGTDDLGRDILVRVIYGARASLLAGVISVGIALSIGVPLGLAAGYLGGFLESLIGRMTDAMLACPFLILAIALAAFLGPSLGNAMIAIGVTVTPIFVRLTRGQVLAVKMEDYVEAARAVGNSRWRIVFVHILPNIMPALLVQATLSIAAAIIAEAALSFLGLGATAAGTILGQHAQFGAALPCQRTMDGRLARTSIFLTVLSFNLVGDGLRDALDPREVGRS
jgi:peptide/nickel transport system permease protein